MELRFQNKPLRCMRQTAWETRNDEQTLEIRLADHMAPVGKILAVWGQPLIRGKEWKNDCATVSGGVTAWVLYDTEDGSEPQMVTGWIPFQFKWDLQDSVHDGVIQSQWQLRSIDARLIGAGKLLVRASVSAYGEALENSEYDIFLPGELPEDVHVQTTDVKLCVPMEAGEKYITMEEDLVIPPGGGNVTTLLAYMVRPVVREKKLMADKLVFRGVAKLQLVYIGDDSRIHTYDTDIPISQYTQLEREYGPDSLAWLSPVLSELEVEKTDGGGLRLKGAIIGQYLICDHHDVNMVEDAYSNRRSVELQREQVRIPNLVSGQGEEIKAKCIIPVQSQRNVACSMWSAQPTVRADGDRAAVALDGTAQVLYYDGEGQLNSESKSWEQLLECPAGESRNGMAVISPVAFPEMINEPDGILLEQDMTLTVRMIDQNGLSMVTGLALGETGKADPDRPSLVICRADGKTLWELAKSCGSTVSAIRSANGIEEAPEDGSVLLIPVE